MPMKFLTIRSRSEAAVDNGKGFVSATGPKSVAAGNNYIGFFPTGTTKLCCIRRIIVAGDAAMRFRFTQAPSTSANGTAQSVLNRRMGKGQVNEAVLYYTPTVTTEGTVVYDFWILASQQVILDFTNTPWEMDPGNSLLINAVAAGANNASLSIEWDEEVR